MNYIINKEEYLSAITAWKHPGYHRESCDHIIYNLIRGHDPKRGFTPLHNPGKLSNGHNPDEGYIQAKYNAKWMFRSSNANAYTTPDRKIIMEAEYNKRIANLNLRFGIQFTPELIEKIREELK